LGIALGFTVAFFAGGGWFFICEAGLLLVLVFLVGEGGGDVGDLLGGGGSSVGDLLGGGDCSVRDLLRDGLDVASPSNTLSSYRAL
jgi:hypothetical protein